MKKEDFGSWNADQVAHWINDTYHINPQLVQRKDGEEETWLYSWVQGRTYRSAEIRNNRLVKLSQTELQDGPTFAQVVSGLGTPDSVYGFGRVFEGVEYVFSLEYPSQGITVGRATFRAAGEIKRSDGLELHLTPELQANFIDCYEPAPSVEQVLEQVYRDAPAAAKSQAQLRTPWPGFGAWVPLQ